MKQKTILIALITTFFSLSLHTMITNAYSDPVGVFARIDKVVFEPNADKPERIQIWGVFALASAQSGSNYLPAQRGYLYFSLKPGKEDVCRKEWADLKAMAGTDQITAFGRRYEPTRLRKSADKPADPDVYPVGMGLVKISDRGVDYPPILDLRSFPKGK